MEIKSLLFFSMLFFYTNVYSATKVSVTKPENRISLNPIEQLLQGKLKEFPKIDLSGCTISGGDFSSINISGANLSQATIISAKLVKANLSKAIIDGTIFFDVDLTEANLSNITHQPQPSSRPTMFINSKLTKANLSNSTIRNVMIIKTDIADAFLNHTDLSGETSIITRSSFKGSDLTSANLSKTTLCDVNLTNTTTLNTNFKDVIGITDEQLQYLTDHNAKNLPASPSIITNVFTSQSYQPTAAELNYAEEPPPAPIFDKDTYEKLLSGKQQQSLSNANLYGANISNISLFKTNLDGSNLAKAKLNNVKFYDTSDKQNNPTSFKNAYLSGATITNCDLSYADLSGANLTNATFIDSNLSYANLTNANLMGTIFFNVKLRNAKLIAVMVTEQIPYGPTMFINSDLTNADLSKSSMQSTIIIGSKLNNTTLYYTDLSGMATVIASTSLEGADLTGAVFYNTTVNNININQTTISMTNFGDTKGLTNDQIQYLIDNSAKYFPAKR